MSDSGKAGTRPKTGWIYHLTKAEVIRQLRNRGASCAESTSIDDLRKQLATLVKGQGTKNESEVTERNETRGPLSGGSYTSKNAQQTERASVLNASERKQQRVLFTELYDMAENTMSTKLEFQLGRDNWEIFQERLELFFVATDVNTEDKKRAELLTKISAETYTLVRDLCAPAKPVTKTYAELTKLVTDLCPKPSEAMERCKFHQATQTTTESVAEFVARLKSLALHCNFVDRDTAVRDQLVCGLKNHDTRMELFRTDALTYDTAYKIATGRELARKNAATTANLNNGGQAKQEMNFLAKGKNPR